jgi:hypothetical protein
MQPAPRPSAINVFGILNIAFAVMGFFGVISGAAMLFMSDSMNENPFFKNNPVIKIMREDPNYRLVTEISFIVGIPIMLLLVISGIGLLKVKRWGRTLALIYGFLGIITSIVTAFVNYQFLAKPLLAQSNLKDPQAAGAVGGAIGSIFGGCLNLIYPVLLIFFMLRPNIVAAFNQGSTEPAPPTT